ncbi:MAG: CDP-diacylglycerol--glycerol-3-phosphate 3-phosphatidyltransferase [Myxococcota bacterium]|nr:CDP-diacylglycerol--glycerol-3-phosphate 3-phosphatidyltransferase [Myxococcota bacterium]
MWNLPNIITVGRLGLLPIILWMLWPGVETRELCYWASLLYGLAGILDIVDGAIARRTNSVTVIGKFLDPLADKLFALITLIALLQLPGTWVPAWIVMVIATREIVITGTRAIAASDGIIIAAGEGGKLKTVFSTLGTCALIMHYKYYVDFIVFEGVIDCYEIGLLLTYISLAYSLTSAYQYIKGFLQAQV